MKNTKKILSLFTALAAGISMMPSAGMLSLSDITVIRASDKIESGHTKHGYDYELWNKDNIGTAEMELIDEYGGFKCSWKDIEECMFNTGIKLGSTKHYDDYLTLVINYDIDYEPNGNSFIGVYGWAERPTAEYYIVEAWGDWRPPGIRDSKFQISSDAKTYDVYTQTRVNQPSIHGTETYEQYWSVNVHNSAQVNHKTNIKGTVTISNHFKAWENKKMEVGYLYSILFGVESHKGSGSALVKRSSVFGGIIPTEEEPIITDTPPVIPTEPEMKYEECLPSALEDLVISANFEKRNAGSWTNRGDGVNLLLSSDLYHSGSLALAVVNRDASWNGIQASSSELKAGCSYDISSYITYSNKYISSADFTIGYQYDDSKHETIYYDIADVSTSPREWAKLGGSFTIPDDASNISLYIQSKYTEEDNPSDQINFFVDDITLTPLSDSQTPAVTTAVTNAPAVTATTGDSTAPAVTTTTDASAAPAVTTPAASAAPAVTAPAENVSGDIDNNGTLNSKDLIKLMQHLIGKATLTPEQKQSADMNNDGMISIIDLIRLKNMLL